MRDAQAQAVVFDEAENVGGQCRRVFHGRYQSGVLVNGHFAVSPIVRTSHGATTYHGFANGEPPAFFPTGCNEDGGLVVEAHVRFAVGTAIIGAPFGQTRRRRRNAEEVCPQLRIFLFHGRQGFQTIGATLERGFAETHAHGEAFFLFNRYGEFEIIEVETVGYQRAAFSAIVHNLFQPTRNHYLLEREAVGALQDFFGDVSPIFVTLYQVVLVLIRHALIGAQINGGPHGGSHIDVAHRHILLFQREHPVLPYALVEPIPRAA